MADEENSENVMVKLGARAGIETVLAAFGKVNNAARAGIESVDRISMLISREGAGRGGCTVRTTAKEESPSTAGRVEKEGGVTRRDAAVGAR